MKLVLIDTFGFLFRSFYALPRLKSSSGKPTGLLTGFVNFVHQLHERHKEDYIIFALEGQGKGFRNDIFEAYKQNRSEVPVELKQQIPIAIKWVKKMQFATAQKDGFEADDVIASLTQWGKKEGFEVLIYSHDKDLLQLLDNKVVLVDPKDQKILDDDYCWKKFGVRAKDFIEFQAILGDGIDNIPGAKGFGLKSAAALIAHFGTIKNMYARLDEVQNLNFRGVKKAKESLLEQKEQVQLSLKLVTLVDDLVFNFDAKMFKKEVQKLKNPILNIKDELLAFEVVNVLKKVEKQQQFEAIYEEGIKHGESKQVTDFKVKTTLIADEKQLKKVINSIDPQAIVAFDTETTGLNVHEDDMVGFSFSVDGVNGFYVPVDHRYLGVCNVEKKTVVWAIEQLFLRQVVGHNIKFDLQIVHRYCQREFAAYADTIILAWLLAPVGRLGMDELAKKYLDHECISFKSLVGAKKTFADIEVEKAAAYAGEDAVVTWALYRHLCAQFKEKKCNHLLDLALKSEMPFMHLLLKMQNDGIALDVNKLEELSKKFQDKLVELRQDIWRLADEEFNLNSPRQLGVILFEKLGLPVSKRTKTGYSTNENALQGLKNAHPMIALLLEYRELFKLQSTYCEPLLKKSQNEPIVHTNFNQTGTSTGRLSSSDPNLQNIPTKSATGREIRQAFVPRKGKCFVGIDYSQIELRLLAHFSGDTQLIQAYQNCEDIHAKTAQIIFGQNKDGKRDVAKSINFGILYGMGANKLAQTINVDLKEARDFIARYFDSFPTILNFINQTKARVREYGFVETYLKRRCHFDFMTASKKDKAMYERMAVNAIFQGSAADLIKISMLRINDYITQNRFDAKMLLQIHDELIFEVNENELHLGHDFYKIMTDFDLKVPLECSLNYGKSWADLK